ncbi:DNA methyltransferase [Sporomusa acidovorans]|uniref:DNA methyltransferase n=1 Tax=Sporomusa acidovorans TaxID=112900 RepID=UPI0035A0E854
MVRHDKFNKGRCLRLQREFRRSQFGYHHLNCYSQIDSLSTVWRFEKPLRNGEHPTRKPIGLCARTIQNSSRPDEIVADFFWWFWQHADGC